MKAIQRILKGDLLLLFLFSLVLVSLVGFVLFNISPLLSSDFRPLVFAAAGWCLACYLFAVINSALQLRKHADKIYSEELRNRPGSNKED